MHENFARYTTDVHRRVEPWWAYAPICLAGTLPWTIPACLALARPGFGWRGGSGGFDPTRLLWVWSVFTVLFFSASHSKLPPYVLPILPAVALLCARDLLQRGGVRLAGATAIVVAVALAIVPMVPDWIAAPDLPRSLLEGYLPYIAAASAILLVAGFLTLLPRWSERFRIAVLGCAALAALQVVVLGFQSLSAVHSSRALAAAIDAQFDRRVPVYVVDRYDQPLPFYLRRTVELVRVRGELEYGIAESPSTEIEDVEAFWDLWRAEQQRVAVMPRRAYRAMIEAGLQSRVVYEDPRRVAVARF